MDFEKLKAPFDPKDIQWRIAQSGIGTKGPWAKVLAYVDNRAIMSRLDEVCGAMNWWNEFRQGPLGGVICGITIRCGEHVVTKWDGADNTQVEEVKGGLSDSMKRAAVQWGIGRYLYDLEEGWAEFVESKGRYNSCIKKNKEDRGEYHHWNPPALPPWALPNGARAQSRPTNPAAEKPNNNGINSREKVNGAFEVGSGPYNTILKSSIVRVMPTPEWKSAWPEGIKQLQDWALTATSLPFKDWKEVMASTDAEALRQLEVAISEETVRRTTLTPAGAL